MITIETCIEKFEQQKIKLKELPSEPLIKDEFYAASVSRMCAYVKRTEKLVEQLKAVNGTLTDASAKMTLAMQLNKAMGLFDSMHNECLSYVTHERESPVSIQDSAADVWSELSRRLRVSGNGFQQSAIDF